MKISLIGITPMDIFCPGIRALSAYLKRAGFDVRLIFLDGETAKFRKGNYVYGYEETLMDELIELCRDSKLLGMSFMTPHFDRAVQASKVLKKAMPETLFIWGGVHAKSSVEKSLEYADGVCMGEGEVAMLQLAKCLKNGKDYFSVNNFSFRNGNDIIQNPPSPIIDDLDSLPFIDYELQDDWVNDKTGKSFIKVNNQVLEQLMIPFEDREGKFHGSYRTMITRGCPHSCSFCGNSMFKALYSGQKFHRRRSNENVLLELEQMKAKFPFVGHIHFFDDTFFSASTENIIEFSQMYKERICLPFHANCSPLTINQDKYDAMIEAGLVNIDIGLQSGSERIKKIYNREGTNGQFLEAARIIHSHINKLKRFDIHIILDNPWEEYNDLKETMDVILKTPKPRTILPSGLIFFPGTEISRMAIEKGLPESLISKSQRQHLSTPSPCYANFVFFLTAINCIPNSVIKLLFSKVLYDLFNRKAFNNFFWLAYEAIRLSAQFTRLTGSIMKGRFKNTFRYIRHIRIRVK